MNGNGSADLAVVGGGIVGAFVAHEASRLHPDWRVLLLERHAIGAGATGWSAGVSFPLAATGGHRTLVRDSAVAYERLGDSPFVRPVPMVYVVRRDRADALRSRFVNAVPRDATDVERKRLLEILPDVALDGDEELLAHDGHGFAVRARALAESLVLTGVEVQLGQHVDAVEPDGDGYRLRCTRGDWAARRVVLASGAWTAPGPLEPPHGARRKRIAALYARLPVQSGDPLVYFVDDDLFVLPLGTGSALVSFYRDEWDTDPDTCDGRPSEDDLSAGIAALGRRSVHAAAAVTGGRAFCDLYTENRLPVVVQDRALPGIAAVRGGSGSGVRLAPGLATQALRAVSGTPQGGDA